MNEREALKRALEALEDNQHLVADNERHAYVMEYNDLIEKCKEALAQPAQEPVAWVCHGVNGEHDVDFDENEVNAIPVGTLLYTTPPQRTWVGLTDEEKADLFEGTAPYYNELDYADAIEAKLKEKNT